MPGEVIGGETVPSGGIEGGDWRNQLQQDSRQRIVNKIMETMKSHLLPLRPGQEGLQQLKKIAVRFEEKIYTEATSLSDYLRKISLKILTMEAKSQNPIANPLQANAASNSRNPQDPASLDSSSRTWGAGGDWQDEIYQKIKSMHELYYPELNEMYQRMAAKLQQHDAIPRHLKNEQLEKLRLFKLMLERQIMFLRTNKNDILPNHKEKIVGVEKRIVKILNINRPRKPAARIAQPTSHACHATVSAAASNVSNAPERRKEGTRVLTICKNSFRRYSIVTLMDSPLLPSRAARRLAPQTRETPQKRAPEISPPNSKGSASALGQQVHQGSNGIAARKRMAGNGMSEDSRRAGRKQKISTGQDVSSRGISAGTS